MVLARMIIEPWPLPADIVDRQIVSLPPLVPGEDWAVYACPDGTVEVSSEKQGDPGFHSYRHNVELVFAGFLPLLSAELSKHLNAGAVLVAEMQDDVYAVLGTSYSPLYLKSNFKSGKKGNDKRGYTIKGEQDGIPWDLLPLSPAMTPPLAAEFSNDFSEDFTI
jgi:hypothetical protein